MSLIHLFIWKLTSFFVRLFSLIFVFSVRVCSLKSIIIFKNTADVVNISKLGIWFHELFIENSSYLSLRINCLRMRMTEPNFIRIVSIIGLATILLSNRAQTSDKCFILLLVHTFLI